MSAPRRPQPRRWRSVRNFGKTSLRGERSSRRHSLCRLAFSRVKRIEQPPRLIDRSVTRNRRELDVRKVADVALLRLEDLHVFLDGRVDLFKQNGSNAGIA